MFRGPLFEPFARNEWYLVNHMCQKMVELGTAAHTLRSHPTFPPFASWLLCVRLGNRIVVRLRLTAKRKNHPPIAFSGSNGC